MVHQSFNTSSSVKYSHKLFRYFIVVGLLVFATLAVIDSCVKAFLGDKSTSDNSQIVEQQVSHEPTPESSQQSNSVPAVNFQPAVDVFLSSSGGTKSLLIFDVERDELVTSLNSQETYNTASLYKLFVVYEGYKKIESGSWNASDPLGTTGYSVLECLDLAIRESHSPCAEALWDKIGRAELEKTIESNYHAPNTDISHLLSTPEDILAVMKLFYYHPDIVSSELVTKLKDSFLNQPATSYDWRQGLPSGFSKANVFNKVGWEYNEENKTWNVYHDAAIIEFPEDNRHFIVVVMTRNVPFSKITELGTGIEKQYYESR